MYPYFVLYHLSKTAYVQVLLVDVLYMEDFQDCICTGTSSVDVLYMEEPQDSRASRLPSLMPGRCTLSISRVHTTQIPSSFNRTYLLIQSPPSSFPYSCRRPDAGPPRQPAIYVYSPSAQGYYLFGVCSWKFVGVGAKKKALLEIMLL